MPTRGCELSGKGEVVKASDADCGAELCGSKFWVFEPVQSRLVGGPVEAGKPCGAPQPSGHLRRCAMSGETAGIRSVGVPAAGSCAQESLSSAHGRAWTRWSTTSTCRRWRPKAAGSRHPWPGLSPAASPPRPNAKRHWPRQEQACQLLRFGRVCQIGTPWPLQTSPRVTFAVARSILPLQALSVRRPTRRGSLTRRHKCQHQYRRNPLTTVTHHQDHEASSAPLPCKSTGQHPSTNLPRRYP